jgi:hypothetical protein
MVLACEAQNEVSYSMPVRNMLYDALSYTDQMSEIWNNLSEAEKKAKFVDNMQTAIQSIEKDDPNRANKIRENLNNLSRKGGALEKAFERKKAQDSNQTPGAKE